ncbi:hypothetical protein IE4872_PD00142 (plasmid) [Rhizobium gallicum]|uniref:Uncharacterized protein n=1 Tax=Rhizobium gallicum TaxID=56730 RepID=A0A1L5NS22_9HYPH|nr:hypothetical protein IE4872_PD00142 [Rhizobium gallicum]
MEAIARNIRATLWQGGRPSRRHAPLHFGRTAMFSSVLPDTRKSWATSHISFLSVSYLMLRA